MTVLGHLFGTGKRKDIARAPEEDRAAPCPHRALAPHWGSVADMGKADRVTVYVCSLCHATFTREEGEKYLHHPEQRTP